MTAVAEDVEEGALIARLRAGDAESFTRLVERYHGAMIGVALGHVRTRAIAEDVVQEAWLGVLKGLERFEGRSSLRTWIFRILTNQAKTTGVREARTIPLSELTDGTGWAQPATLAEDQPEERAVRRELQSEVRGAIDALPARQRAVITLRDVQGSSAPEACRRLSLSEGNQRVLLHRARTAVRAAVTC